MSSSWPFRGTYELHEVSMKYAQFHSWRKELAFNYVLKEKKEVRLQI